MVYPTSITASNVLDGIADAVAIIRNPGENPNEQDQTITFDTGPFNPPLIHFDPVIIREREFRTRELDIEFQVRARITFTIPFLTAAEAAKWRRLWNELMNGYHVWMRPHNDNDLKLEWNVIPMPGTSHVLRYFNDRYIGHAAEFSFISRTTQRSMNLRTSAVTFNPVIW